MVVGEASTRNIIGGMESTGGVRLHNHKRKLKQRFDIIKKLGQGTYGKVQLGINKETGQEVAIKTIKKCKIETEADLIRIRREIQIMSSVQHPNIIHIYEVFENKEKIVLVMEYAAGGDLFDYILKRGVLAEHEARLLFRQIAMAVYYCHKHQICHRDLKLENILLDQNCNAKIADFGLSNIFDERRLLKTFCGSPLYASPEIVRGIPYCGPEVDCWCLGVLLYALVYSAMPFDGSNFKRLVKQITQPDYYEDEKNKSRASGLIKQLLNISPSDRADIKRVCSHWWVNEGFDENCLNVAENLACQTPIRLDLLLALVPESAASPDNLVVEDEQQPPCVEEAAAAEKSQESSLVPTRCHSEGSLMEIDVPVEINTEEQSPVGRWKKRKESAEPEPEYMVYSPTEENPPQLQPSKSLAVVEKQSVVEQEQPNVATVAPPEESNEVPKQTVSEPSVSEVKGDEESSPKKEPVARNTERRRSKIFETAEKFQTREPTTVPDAEKKKIFIPGVNVGGAKRAFERKASLTSPVVATPNSPLSPQPPPSRVIIDVGQPTEISSEEPENTTREDDKKRAATIITGALARTPPTTPESNQLGLKIQLGPNDVRNATVSVSTPVDNKYPFDNKAPLEAQAVSSIDPVKEPAKQSKMEITLKSATLPRPRKTSRAEITLSGFKAPEAAFKSEVEAKIGNYPRKLRTLKSEIAFPVAAVVPPMNRSTSLENPKVTSQTAKERIIPIQMETTESQKRQSAQSLPPKPPASLSQRSMSQRSSSLSRQSTESDTDSALGSTTVGPEPIRKSPREYIIPIAVEGGGYVTPRSGSVEPEGKNLSSRMFGKPRRMSSLLSDASEDDTLSVPRDNEDLLHRHMHRLRSSRPFRQMPEHADSLSSGEDDDDDDGFELLTAENLFSTLLSRVRSLTQRLNVDDAKGSGFPNSRLLSRMASNPKSFGLHDQPLSSYESYYESQAMTTRISESQFRRSMSRERDSVFNSREFGRAGVVPNSRESVFETPSSSNSSCNNNSPRDKLAEECRTEEAIKEAQESLEQNFTPSLARRLSRQFIEQTRQALARSPCSYREPEYLYPGSVLDQLEKKRSALKRNIRRANSLLDSRERYIVDRGSRRSISLFEDGDETSYEDDNLAGSLPKLLVSLARKKREQPDKIQEEPNDDSLSTTTTRATVTSSTSSCDTSPNNSCATITRSNNFENRMLAAENLIKESKLKNLGPSCGDSALSESPRARSLAARSTSLTREPRYSLSPERSLLSKLFRGNNRESDKQPPKVKSQKRISRFLRPDFFDTPREESQYVKEQEAQKAADNERRKSRFIGRKKTQDVIPQKELKNEANLAAQGLDNNKEEKPVAPKTGFFQTLEKKLDKLRSSGEEKGPDEATQATAAPPPTIQPSLSKSKMSSVLELFRNDETSKSQNKTKKAPLVYKGSRSADGGLAIEAPSSAASKIPTKLAGKVVAAGSKQALDKGSKKSPPPVVRTSPEITKSTKLPKKSPEKTLKKDGSTVKIAEVNKSPEKTVLRKKKTGSPEVKPENKDKETKTKVLVKKKVVKPDSDEKKEDNEEATKKKKKIVRVVKKVVKKSPDEKANGSETKTLARSSSSSSGAKKSEPTNGTVKIKRKSPESVKEAGPDEQPKVTAPQKKNRANLKLDLSKIPQHSSFRNNNSHSNSNNHQHHNGSIKKQAARVEGASDEKIEAANKAAILVSDEAAGVERTETAQTVGESNHVEDDRGQSDAASPDVTLREMPLESPTVGKRDVTSDRSTAEDMESLDSWSVCSADVFGSRAPSELHSPTSPTYSFYLRGDTQESIIDRIRRKSFYSRFNDRKKKTPLTSAPSAISMTSSLTLPRKFSFGSSRCSTGGGYSTNRRSNPEKCYSLYGEEDIPSRKKSPKSEKDRYSDSSSISSFSDHKGSTGPSTSHEPLLRYPKSSRKYSSLEDNSLLSSRNNSTLPRKYKYSSSSLEPKTVKYFEDLLAPTTQDAFSSSRCSPISSDCKNGYHNGKQETKDEPKNEDMTSFRNYASSTDYFDPAEHRVD